jgi:methyl-accepting chemotaxis protein
MKNLLQRISVSKKLGFIMMLSSLVVLSGTMFFIVATSILNDDFENFEKQSFEGVKAVLETEKELNYFSRLTREIMLGGDLDENLEKLDKTLSKINTHFNEIDNSIVNSEEKIILKHAKDDALIFLNSSRELMYTIKSKEKNLVQAYKHYHKNFSPLAKASRTSMDKLVEAKMNEAKSMKAEFSQEILTWRTLAGIGGLLAIIGMNFIMMMISSQIKDSLIKTQNGLIAFFNFLGAQQEKATLLPNLGEDEFGTMGGIINDNINSLEKKFIEQQQSIIDFDAICSYASKGFMYNRITTQYTDPNLTSLSKSLNGMLDEIEQNFGTLIGMLTKMAQGNFKHEDKHSTESLNGSFASMMQAVDSMSISNSEIFALISKFSIEFSQEATVLSESGDELSTSANEQASSLEETAAAIEELTSNVAANASKAEEMSHVAKEAKIAAERGNSVAQVSLSAMNEIVSATEAIHQAVEIIDNIAFQTNILSLNAAVEAASAGDAGKGFAVVAQEVRNLANRSADAASQIKNLARTAREKSQGGLETSKNMMESFSVISTKIAHTDDMVRDVANASREQMAGISQINDAVSQLDQMTQQNAKTANNVAQIANEILYKTEQFEQMLSRIEFEESYQARSCDTELLFDIAKLKLDHVTFKENNYRQLKSATSNWSVTGHHECALGKWLDEHSSEEYAQSSEWQALLKDHEAVHTGVQELVNADTSDQNMETFYAISKQLEDSTQLVFNGLDSIKILNCTHKG